MAWIKRVAYQRRLPPNQIKDASVTVLPYGSYGLGVYNADSNIDLLCVGPCFASMAEDYFIVLHNMLAGRSEVFGIHCVKGAKVPLLHFTFERIMIDLSFAKLQVVVVPENVDVSNPSFIKSIDKTSSKNFSGVRLKNSILQLVPDVKNMEMTECDCAKGADALLKVPPNSSIPISYHPLFGSHDDLLLLELDEKLLPDVINQRVSLRGQPDEDAVFCTRSKTYAIKFVGTSNSVFLVPPSNQYTINKNTEDLDEKYPNSNEPFASVLKLAPGTMELVEVAPKIDKLKSLLSENTYKYDGDCNKYDTGLYRWDDLIDRVQASDEELRSALRAFSAVEIDGYWRIVDEKYMYRIRSMLINNSLINDWSLNALDENEVVESLVKDKFSRDIAHHCLEVFGTRTNGCEKGGKSIWSLDKTRVCVHIAREILARGKMKMESFMEEWTMEAPSGMVVSLDMLESEVLVEKLGIQSWVYAFSVSSLPSDPANRFARLFQERSKWDWKDLHPYIRDLSVPGLTSDGLLLKYTRRTQPTADAEPVFTAR